MFLKKCIEAIDSEFYEYLIFCSLESYVVVNLEDLVYRA